MSEKLKAFSMDLISDIPSDIHSEEYRNLTNQLIVHGGEAKYVYSLKDKKMLFAKGWSLLGYKDEEVDMLNLGLISAPAHYKFTNELNQKALTFLSTQREDLEKYSFIYRVNKMHKNGYKVPLLWRVSVFKSENGFVTEILGEAHLLQGVPFGDVVYYEAYGPEAVEFEESLNDELFHTYSCTKKELEVLKLTSEGYAYKEIADMLGVSMSAIEKRIRSMTKRFNVTGLPHLISFAHRNRLL